MLRNVILQIQRLRDNYYSRTHSGVIVLTLMILVGTIITVIAVLMLYTSANVNKIRFYQSYSQRLFFHVDSCAEEALLRLEHDAQYIGGTLSYDISSCTITVTGSGNTRSVQVSASNNNDAVLQLNMVRTLQINVTIFPTFAVTSWQELTT